MPSMSQMLCIGTSAETSATKSTSPLRRCRRRCGGALASIRSPMRAICLGVNGRRQQPPDLGVPGRVHRDEALRGVEQLLRHRLEDDALAGEEVVVPLGHLDQVGVPDDGPEALVVGVFEQPVGDRAVPGDGPVAAQLGEGALALDGGGRPEVERGQVGVVVRALGPGDRGAGRRHGTSVRWACHGLSYT
jgi:hypothetical protein